MASNRPDFDQINKLIGRLETLESDFAGIFGEEQIQRQTLQGLCRQAARIQAVDALAEIPVGELKNSRAGIRTAALEKAGFHNLLDLYRAPDYALQAVDGVGEKQVDSIRVILDEFLNRLAERERIRLTVDLSGEESAGRPVSADGEVTGRSVSSDRADAGRPAFAGKGSHEGAEREKKAQLVRELIHGFSVYRQAEAIRRDARPIREEFPQQVRQVTEAVEIRSRLKWFFPGARSGRGQFLQQADWYSSSAAISTTEQKHSHRCTGRLCLCRLPPPCRTLKKTVPPSMRFSRS